MCRKRNQALGKGQRGVVAVDFALRAQPAGTAIDDFLELGLYWIEVFGPQCSGHVQIALGVEKLQLLGCESGHAFPSRAVIASSRGS